MEIVLIAHFAGAPKYGMVYGHYHLAKQWVRMGHTVTIVAASYAHTRHSQPNIHSRVTEEFIDGIRYLWIKTPSYSPNSKLGRVAGILSFTAQCWLMPLAIKRADLVICSSHHPFAIHPAKKLAKEFRAKLVFEVRDLWPLTLIELGGLCPQHPFIRLMQMSEDYAYKIADKVVSVLPKADSYMQLHGMDARKFLYVPNGIEINPNKALKELPPNHRQTLRSLKASGKLLVGYAGKIGLSNLLEPFIEAIAKCEDGNIHAVILGDGEFLPELQRKVHKLELDNQVTFLEVVSRDQVKNFLSYLDIAYVGLPKQPLFRFGVSPTKISDYMLAALPIIYAISAPGDVVAESGAGISCEPEDSDAIYAALIKMRDMGTEARQAMGAQGQKWVIENRDYAVLAKQFLDGVYGSNETASRIS
jgi:glycosyltransferase involved in cell wall biosynthesis